MADDTISVTQPPSTVTVTRPIDHFTEYLYTFLIFLMLMFVTFMSHVHNDSLAGKGMEFTWAIIGALTQASRGGAKA